MSLAFRATTVAVVTSLLMLSATVGSGQQTCTVQSFEYVNKRLRIRGQMIPPSGPGPFPVVVWNQGYWLRRSETPHNPLVFPPDYPCALYPKGWLYFFPDRRGIGRSEGPAAINWEGLSGDARFQAFVKRNREETGDVLAGLVYLKSLAFADPAIIAIVGNREGAHVTLLAASTAPAAFRTIVLKQTFISPDELPGHRQVPEWAQRMRDLLTP